MITAIRLEGIGESPQEIQTEFDALLGHVCMAGLLEGIVPWESEVPKGGEVYPRRHHSEPFEVDGRKFYFAFEGRKVVHFLPAEYEQQRPRPQTEYEVLERPGEPVNGPQPIALSGPAVSLGFTTTFSSAKRDVSPEVIVLHRQMPMDWPDPVRSLPPTITTDAPAKLRPEDLARFTELAIRDDVDTVGYEPVDGGYTITLQCLLKDARPTDGPQTAFGWSSKFHGETLRDAADAAIADCDARRAEFVGEPTG